MRIIFDNKAGVITATNQDANFPTTNLADDNPTNVWKATTAASTMTILMVSGWAAGTKDVALYNCNQSTAIDLTWELQAGGGGVLDSGVMETDGIGNFWINSPGLGPITTTNKYVLSINAGIGQAEAGSVRVGFATGGTDFRFDKVVDPIEQNAYGDPVEITVSYEHLGPKPAETNNQAYEYTQKNRIWRASGSIWSQVNTVNWLPYIMLGAKEAAPLPVAMKFWTADEGQWILFGEFNCTSKKPTRQGPTADKIARRALCSFSVKEVI